MLGIQEVHEARERISGYAVETPLLSGALRFEPHERVCFVLSGGNVGLDRAFGLLG